jgi:hypothetical protein
MHVAPGALLQDKLDGLPDVFKTHWPSASADSFSVA